MGSPGHVSPIVLFNEICYDIVTISLDLLVYLRCLSHPRSRPMMQYPDPKSLGERGLSEAEVYLLEPSRGPNPTLKVTV